MKHTENLVAAARGFHRGQAVALWGNNSECREAQIEATAHDDRVPGLSAQRRRDVKELWEPHLSSMAENHIPRLSDHDLAANVAANGGLGKVITFLEAEDLRHSIPEVLAGRVAANPDKVQILEYSLAGPLADEASLVEVRFHLGASVRSALVDVL